jgi:hypothetical protein
VENQTIAVRELRDVLVGKPLLFGGRTMTFGDLGVGHASAGVQMKVPQRKDAKGRFIPVRSGPTAEQAELLAAIEKDLDQMIEDKMIEAEHRDTAKLLLCAMNFGCENIGKLTAISGLPRDRIVRPRAERLRKSGIWLEDGGVCFEYPEGPPEKTNLEFVLHVLVAEGEIVRHPEGTFTPASNSKFDALFAWRIKMLPSDPAVTAEVLAESLTVEALAYQDIPTELERSVFAFRHLRQDARVGSAKRWLEETQSTRLVKNVVE